MWQEFHDFQQSPKISPVPSPLLSPFSVIHLENHHFWWKKCHFFSLKKIWAPTSIPKQNITLCQRAYDWEISLLKRRNTRNVRTAVIKDLSQQCREGPSCIVSEGILSKKSFLIILQTLPLAQRPRVKWFCQSNCQTTISHSQLNDMVLLSNSLTTTTS